MKLNAELLNCTLKKSPEVSNTQALMDILIIGTSIWFGVRNSVCQMVIERLDGTYESTNDVGQYPMYNKVAGVVVTGNEDGAHAAAETTLFNLSHLGSTIPPNSDTYPGPASPKTAGWMAHDVVHLARILRQHPIPPEGNTVLMKHIG